MSRIARIVGYLWAPTFFLCIGVSLVLAGIGILTNASWTVFAFLTIIGSQLATLLGHRKTAAINRALGRLDEQEEVMRALLEGRTRNMTLDDWGDAYFEKNIDVYYHPIERNR